MNKDPRTKLVWDKLGHKAPYCETTTHLLRRTSRGHRVPTVPVPPRPQSDHLMASGRPPAGPDNKPPLSHPAKHRHRHACTQHVHPGTHTSRHTQALAHWHVYWAHPSDPPEPTPVSRVLHSRSTPPPTFICLQKRAETSLTLPNQRSCGLQLMNQQAGWADGQQGRKAWGQ